MKRWLYKATGEEICTLGGFSVLLCDAPWKYNVEGGRGAADKQYRTMSVPELCLLPVEQLAAPDAVLFMWTVWPMLLESFAVMKAWGFSFKNCALLWAKTNSVSPTPFVGLGHWTRGNTEPCLMAVRGKPKRVSKAVQQLMIDNLIVAPIGEHSAKPDEARRRIAQLMGDVPSIELFARAPAANWECWGDQVESTVVLEESHEESDAAAPRVCSAA
jgi:site-specific DNA-methyltransferase (adenine-specific)